MGVAERCERRLATQVANVLFAVPPCPDGETGRACRWCEAEAVARWINAEMEKR